MSIDDKVERSLKYRILKTIWWTSYKVYKWAGNHMVWMIREARGDKRD